MAHILPKLQYNDDALEPYISKKTIEFHYRKHHQAYLNNLNNFIVGTQFENADLETIIRTADGGIYNNGAQLWNHTFYFAGLKKYGTPSEYREKQARIMRARPLIKEWAADFEIVYDEKMIMDTDIIKKIAEEAGQRIGLLDNRPQKYGENGTFQITKWKVV